MLFALSLATARLPTEPTRSKASLHILKQDVSDEDIIERLQIGDVGAAALLYDRYSPEINRLVWRLLGADHEHDDLVQQIFCQLLVAVPKMREACKLPGFVQRTTVNAVRSELRKRAVRRRFFRSHEDFDRFEGLAEDHETRELLRRTFAVLEKMPTSERIAFTLRHVDGRTLEDSAQLCGCSLATVKRRLDKAQKRFRALSASDPMITERLKRNGKRGES